MPSDGEGVPLQYENEVECQAPSAWLVLDNQSGGSWLNPASNLTTGGAQNMPLHVHRHLWKTDILGIQDVYLHPKGLWTEKSVTDPQWVMGPSNLIGSLWARSFGQMLEVRAPK